MDPMDIEIRRLAMDHAREQCSRTGHWTADEMIAIASQYEGYLRDGARPTETPPLREAA